MTDRKMGRPCLDSGRVPMICAALIGAMMAVTMPAPASAQAPAAGDAAGPVTFSIPPQMLDQALTSFADQAGLVLLFSAPEAATIPSDGLTGTLGVHEALRRLLTDTGYAYRFVDARTVTIDRIMPAGSAVALPDMVVTTTAAGYAQKLTDAPASVTVIPREELEKRPSARSPMPGAMSRA
ncbi:hypothetical protein ACFQ4K_29960 [Tistrella bauzanensis]